MAFSHQSASISPSTATFDSNEGSVSLERQASSSSQTRTVPSESTVKTTLACASCRHRKIKCPREKPTCANCEKAELACIYPPAAYRKRRHRERAPVVGSLARPSDPFAPIGNERILPDFLSPTNAFEHYGASTSAAGELPSWQNPVGFQEWNTAQIQDLLQESGVVSNNQTMGLDGLLALNPAYMPVQNENSPVYNTNHGLVGTPTSGTGRIKFRVPYFSGPTAIAPGFKQVTSNVSRAPSPSFRDLSGLMSQPRFSPAPYEEYPHLDAINHLVPVFQTHYGYMFSFIHIPHIGSLEELGAFTPSLINIICALAARYSPLYGGHMPKQGMGDEVDLGGESGWEQISSLWAQKAKDQAGRSLAVSTIELVESLLLISWYEFGGDRDAGLWMYSGMAFRMAQDLGLDAIGKAGVMDTTGADDSKRLHCCLRIMDSVMTIGTGRLGMFQDPDWLSPIFPPVTDLTGKSMPDPYEQLVRIFDIANGITRVLVKGNIASSQEALVNIQKELSEFHDGLPNELRFQASTLQAYAGICRGEAFVLFHAWFHCLIILSYCPDLLIGAGTVVPASDQASIEVAASSAKSISDIVSFAELINARAVCQPWINYPLYLAARTFLYKFTGPSGSINPTGAQAHISRAAQQDYQRIMSMMRVVGKYWRGVRYILRTLEQKAEGIQHVDLSDDREDLAGELLALLENAASCPTGDAVGISLVGTVNSPTDNQFGLIFPLNGMSTPGV